MENSVLERCPVCNGPLTEKKLKKFCDQCGQLCATCCDNGCERDLQKEA